MHCIQSCEMKDFLEDRRLAASGEHPALLRPHTTPAKAETHSFTNYALSTPGPTPARLYRCAQFVAGNGRIRPHLGYEISSKGVLRIRHKRICRIGATHLRHGAKKARRCAGPFGDWV